jgi:hypothetical protein
MKTQTCHLCGTVEITHIMCNNIIFNKAFNKHKHRHIASTYKDYNIQYILSNLEDIHNNIIIYNTGILTIIRLLIKIND